MDKVIEILLVAGYVPDGVTHGETYRIVTQASYPSVGAEISTGGRKRFVLPGTTKRATVGKRIVCFYESVNEQAMGFRNFRTEDFAAIAAILEGRRI